MYKQVFAYMLTTQVYLFLFILVLLSLQSLLGEPNNDSPLNVNAAGLWGCKEYASHVKSEYAKK